MITEANYKRYKREFWVGRKVINQQELSNYFLRVKPGTILTIVGKRRGFSLETEPCPKCGVTIRIAKVQQQDLILLPDSRLGKYSSLLEIKPNIHAP